MWWLYLGSETPDQNITLLFEAGLLLHFNLTAHCCYDWHLCEKERITVYSWKSPYPSWLLTLSLSLPSLLLIFSSCTIFPTLYCPSSQSSPLLLSPFSSLHPFLQGSCAAASSVIPGDCPLTDNWIAPVSCQDFSLFPVWVVWGKISNCIYKKEENELINLFCFLIPACSISSNFFFFSPFSEIDFENRVWYK